MSKKQIYKIIFTNQDRVYEIYARKILDSHLFGFLEVEEFVFGETTSLVVDPSEERLKVEFQDVKRTYIPSFSVIRIDEVDKEGLSKIIDSKETASTKVSQFPMRHVRKSDEY
ncbi:MAG: DUF1820 family protein [Proteobacteria bacterium]|nr:DUF1820 family protein [Pseudomonadota bacterium]